MRSPVVLVVLAGCDLVFTIDPPAIDAAGPIDPPGTLVCDRPAPAPRVVRENSTDYVPNAVRDWAISLELGTTVVQGDDSAPPEPIQFAARIASPRFAADGLRMLVFQEIAPGTQRAALVEYKSDANHVWNTTISQPQSLGGQKDFPIGAYVSAPTREDNRLILDQDGNAFVEFVPATTLPSERAWTERAMYMPSTFQLESGTEITEPSLSPDGLFLTFVATVSGKARIAIVRRASIEQFFGTASVFYTPASGKAGTPYVTNGCSRLFYTDVEGVVVVEFDRDAA